MGDTNPWLPKQMPATVEYGGALRSAVATPKPRSACLQEKEKGLGHGPVGKALSAQEGKWSVDPQYPHKCWVGVAVCL